MKKLTVALLALAMILALVSCGGSSDPALEAAAGTYKGTEYKYNADETWTDNSDFVLELKADGTGTSKRGGEEYEAEWTLDGENFTLKEKFMGISLDYTGTLKDGAIELYDGDPSSELTCVYKFAK